MRLGLHALGIGSGARPEVITAVARGAEAAGFATLWAGEHVVMVDRPRSRYPYADDGRIAVAPDADWLDPLGTLTFAAAATSRIRLATGVVLVAEHHPVMLAKAAATVDRLSGGRFVLGVGAGWSADEFAALGVPFEGRGRRMREYVRALRVLWQQEVSSFEGEFVRFEGLRSYPKPVRAGRIPVVMGGNSDRALVRVADDGDGWYGFNLSMDEVPGRLQVLAARCRERGRDPRDLDVSVALRDGSPGQRGRLEDEGVDELVLVASPPEDPARVSGWLEGLAAAWAPTGP